LTFNKDCQCQVKATGKIMQYLFGEINYFSDITWHPPSGGSRQGVCGGKSNRGRHKVWIVQIPKVACDNCWISHKSGYLWLRLSAQMYV